MQKVAEFVLVNDAGLRVGESHPRAVLTDHEVQLMLALREEDAKQWTYKALAETFEVSVHCVASILTGRRRGQPAYRRNVRAR